MSFKKGQSGNPAGRIKGKQNQATQDTKEAFRTLVEGNLSNIENWIKDIASKDPAKALDILFKMTEFFLPKMKAVELTGSDTEQANNWSVIVHSRPTHEDLKQLDEKYGKQSIVVSDLETAENIMKLGEKLRG